MLCPPALCGISTARTSVGRFAISCSATAAW
jgi:hypothetical protein